MESPDNDILFMKAAIAEAKVALDRGEIPVGAVVVTQNRIIARGHNLTETLNDATAHAEMQAITAATSFLGGKYLEGCTIYITLEPCVMCAGALYWSQVSRIVYGATDKKRGYSLIGQPLLHPKTEVTGEILKDECSTLLKDFFKTKRNQ